MQGHHFKGFVKQAWCDRDDKVVIKNFSWHCRVSMFFYRLGSLSDMQFERSATSKKLWHQTVFSGSGHFHFIETTLRCNTTTH